MKYFLLALLFFSAHAGNAQLAHPIAFGHAKQWAALRGQTRTPGLFQQSFLLLKKEVDAQMNMPVQVPLPKDAAGGYTHEQHKANYMLMFQSGLLYQLTNDVNYARLTQKLLLGYAKLNPGLRNHPQATSSSPGRIFWQALNDANWLVYAGLAYDLVQPATAANDRKYIADSAFGPIVQYITGDLNSWFNLIHNHAVWACAGVGIAGMATDNAGWQNMALKGSNLDGKTGFLAHLNGLFSPDGYYTEGAYYVRYALLPFYVYANALNHAQPSLNIWQYRNGILGKALTVGLQHTNLNGGFFSYNDALKEKTYLSSELVMALAIATQAYGLDSSWLGIAKKQGKVTLNMGGLTLSKALKNQPNAPAFQYKTVVSTDGADGKNGGIAIMRSGSGSGLSSLIHKYSSHGLSHGHFDKLNIQFYHKGNEILQDYGAVRFIGIEQKFGGRYLPETKSYAAQTIAHNTLVANEQSHFKGEESISEKHSPVLLYSRTHNPHLQYTITRDSTAYPGIVMTRTLAMMQLPGMENPLVLDLMEASSSQSNNYDLPYHHLGQFMYCNQKLKTNGQRQDAMGKAHGYQHLWKEASASQNDGVFLFTWLNNEGFYTLHHLVNAPTEYIWARSGATDPQFNLRHDPVLIMRREAASTSFFSVLEPHGNASSLTEVSTQAKPQITGLQMLNAGENVQAYQFTLNENVYTFLRSNDPAKGTIRCQIGTKQYVYNGPVALYKNNDLL